MGKYILRRILYAIPIAFGVSVVCFSLVYIAPGDPLQTVLPPDATAETVAIVKKAYGFDKPLPLQFLIWLGRVVTGDFGVSISTRRPVILEVTQALSNTALLALFAVPIAFFIGYAMGAVAGSFAGRWIDRGKLDRGAVAGRHRPAEILRDEDRHPGLSAQLELPAQFRQGPVYRQAGAPGGELRAQPRGHEGFAERADARAIRHRATLHPVLWPSRALQIRSRQGESAVEGGRLP